ncbi:hypothetical protein SAMN06264348_102166 [Oceanospirillum linum]|nr:hypothetical protein SAMN04489856_105165 [Oleiphilus messinensis]SMP10317.1 hypothetical protein SAMN06264348_102166 [Oceanospirillum linum]
MDKDISPCFPFWVKLLWVIASAALFYRLGVAAGWF